MNNIWVRTILSGILLLALQILVLNGLDISSQFYPQVYFLILLSLPVNTQHWVLMLVGFFLGLHAAALTFVAYLRYGYLKTVMDKEAFSSGIRPIYGQVENAWYVVYISIFSLIFHSALFFLADFTFVHFGETLIKILLSSSLSILLILLIQFVFNSRVRNVWRCIQKKCTYRNCSISLRYFFNAIILSSNRR